MEKYDLFELGAGREMLRVEYTGIESEEHYEMRNLDWPGKGACQIYKISKQEVKNGVTCRRLARKGRHPLVMEALQLCVESEMAREQFIELLSTLYECFGSDVKQQIEQAFMKLPLELRRKLDGSKRCEHCTVNYG